MSNPYDEQQLKKVMLYQDIDLLEKDWLQEYPLVSQFRITKVELDRRNSIILTASFFPMIIISIVAIFFEKKNGAFIVILIGSIVFFVAGVVLLINNTPKYNKYLADKKAYEKKRAQLRKAYDAL